MKFAYPDWLTCKKGFLGGHGKAHRTVILGRIRNYVREIPSPSVRIHKTEKTYSSYKLPVLFANG